MSYTNFIAFVVTPYENYGILCHFGWSYDKGFYGNTIISIFLNRYVAVIIFNLE